MYCLYCQISRWYGNPGKLEILLFSVLGRCIPAAIVGAADTLNDLQKGNFTLDTLRGTLGDDGGIIPSDNAVQNTGYGISFFLMKISF